MTNRVDSLERSPMTTESIPHPPITAVREWLPARKRLLEQEKELTRAYDAVNAARRRLPMVKIEKDVRLRRIRWKRRVA